MTQTHTLMHKSTIKNKHKIKHDLPDWNYGNFHKILFFTFFVARINPPECKKLEIIDDRSKIKKDLILTLMLKLLSKKQPKKPTFFL